VTIISPPAPTVRHSMLATLCALAGALTFTGATAQAANAAGFPPEPCPNEQLRFEQPFALALPECRAYEMVSPVDKGDYEAITTLSPADRASVSGEAITYNSEGAFAEPEGTQYSSQYISRRGPDGWSTQNITPPYLAVTTTLNAAYSSVVFTPDLSLGVASTDVPLTSEAIAGYNNLYLVDNADGSHQLVTYVAEHVPEAVGASTDLSHVVYIDEEGPLYEWVDGQSSLVSVAPHGGSADVPGRGSGSTYFWHAVSHDGLRVFMTFTTTPHQVYVRENPEQPQSPLNGEECTVPGDACTVEVSASQKTNGTGPGGTDPHGSSQPARYWDASVDGSRVFFTSNAELTNDANTGSADNAENLYEYDLEKPAGKRLTDLTVDSAGNGAAVLGVVDISEDGSYVYFVAESELASNENGNKEKAVLGQPNLYLDHDGVIAFIATLSPSDSKDWSGLGDNGLGDNTVRETPDGTHLAFLSTKSLTGYDNTDANTGLADAEVFSYDATAGPYGTLVCASCNPSGAQPVGSSGFGEENGERNARLVDYTSRNFSEDGSRLFFDSRDALVPHATNGLQNVFEYEGGHVYPISTVAGGHESYFVDASANGDDVFIATADQLLPQDTDTRAVVYDARVGGGYPVSVAPPACDNADSCKGPVSPQPGVFGAPASATFSGAGNLVPGVSPPAVLKPKTAAQLKAEKLTKALKACKKARSRKKRAACEKQARKKYGASKAKKASNKRRSR
jgi:hypothetical protein